MVLELVLILVSVLLSQVVHSLTSTRLQFGSRAGAIRLLSSASATDFSLQTSLEALRAVASNKGKQEAVLKRVWAEFGLEALQLISQAASESDLAESFTQDLVDNLSKRNEQSSVKLMGDTLASAYTLSLPRDTNKKGSKGRSEVVDVFSQADAKTYKLKVVKDKNRYVRELEYYNRITGVKDVKKQGKKKSNPAFVAIVDTAPNLFVMEKGLADLREMREATGSVSGKPLKAVMAAMADSVSKIHGKGYVWCDVKLENFVIVPTADNTNLVSVQQSATPKWFNDKNFAVKAIDLESVARKGELMTDFAPETVAPELAAKLRGGKMGTVGSRDDDQKINPKEPIIASQAYDIFALGVCFLQLARSTDGAVLGGTNLQKSFAALDKLVSGTDDLGLSEVQDAGVRRLLGKMLSVDPSKRPNIGQVQRQI